MTDRPTFKPGDLVERTGESIFAVGWELRIGCHYPIAALDERGYLIFAGDPNAAFNPRGFRLVEEG